MTTRRDRVGDAGVSAAFVLVPTVTFLVGLLLGAALVFVTGPDRGQQEAEPAEPGRAATPTPGKEQPVTDACVRAARAADALVDIVRQSASAIAEMDVRRLQRLVDRAEALDREVRDDVVQCEREARASGVG
jgi:hypothetical protein